MEEFFKELNLFLKAELFKSQIKIISLKNIYTWIIHTLSDKPFFGVGVGAQLPFGAEFLPSVNNFRFSRGGGLAL